MSCIFHGLFFLVSSLIPLVFGEDSNCTWIVQHCGKHEIQCNPEENIYLDSKDIRQKEVDCFAVKNSTEDDFKNYEIEVEMLSLKSIEGVNTGTIGLMFNYQDEMNYDFVYVE